MTQLLTVRVARKTSEALGICGLELVPHGTATLPRFTPGAHIDVHLPGGLVRPYSLCNDAAESNRYVLGVLRDPTSRGGSAAVHEAVQEGRTLQVGPPVNRFALDGTAARSLLLAGGIGVTPLLSMAEHLWRAGADFEMRYCTRSVERTAFRERIRASSYAPRVHFHHDDGAAEQRLDLAALLRRPGDGVHLYVCGPQGFIDAALNQARAQGWSPRQLHFESFGATPSASASDSDRPFDVRVASTGRQVTVGRGQTLVQALAAAGITVPTSCEQGVCGTCLTRVLDGIPDHRDQYLTPEEQEAGDQMLPCCSRARSSVLVLDL